MDQDKNAIGSASSSKGDGPPLDPLRTWPRAAVGAAWAIMGLGAALRLASFFSNRSLWEDEAFIALNIRGRSFAGLLSPLDLNQVAPVGFLLSEKLATRLLGPADWVLRLTPLLASLAGLPLFYAVARRVLRVPGALIGLLLFSVSIYVVYYAVEVKQYGTDVTVTLLLLWCALRWMESRASRPRKLILVGAGALALWFSHPALFILGGVGTAMLLAGPGEPGVGAGVGAASAAVSRWTGSKRRLKPLVPPDVGSALRTDSPPSQVMVRSADPAKSDAPARWNTPLVVAFCCWAISFAFVYFVSLRHHVDELYLLGFWAKGFAPLPTSGSAVRWYVDAFSALFTDPVGLDFSFACQVFAVLGGIALYRANRAALAMLTVPILFALLASLLKRYPFQGRLLLFSVPLFLLLIAAGLDALLRARPQLGRGIAALLGFILVLRPVVGALVGLEHFPRQEVPWPPREEMKPVMQYLQAHYRPGDAVYVYSYAAPAFAYYAPVHGLDQVRFQTFFSRQSDDASLANALAPLRGNRRAWVVLAHVYIGAGRVNGAENYLNALDRMGYRQDHFGAQGADLYLFDFSDQNGRGTVTSPATVFAGSQPSMP
jgi:hypothetical protein